MRRLAAVIVGMLLLGAGPAAAAPGPVVATHDGQVQGMVKDGTKQFLGLPFAAPPVGPLRWRPPQKPVPWKTVRQATAFAPRCPQGRDIGDFAKPGGREDCLYLNVFAPQAPAKTPRAVMVWFPGGALFAGDAADYDASLLARRGDLVVVTVNYRIGVLGFFAHPSIDDGQGPHGNYGIMDQQAALVWVRDNIAAFGGDPSRVTIAGQSAGGSSVLMHMLSPASRGLFHRAINQSGGRLAVPTMAYARRIGEAFATAAGCAGQDAACLRALPVETIVAAQTGRYSGVVLDGQVIPEQPAAAFARGDFARVPVINGLVSDEQSFFIAVLARPGEPPLTAQGYADYVGKAFGAKAPEVLGAYPADAYPSPSQAQVALQQGLKACVARRMNGWFASRTPTFAYQFDDATAPSYLAPAGFPLGAYHTAELPYLFPGFHGAGTVRALNPGQQRLALALVDAWAAFARTGDPNGPGLAAWPAYDPARDNVQSFDVPRAISRDGYGATYNCSFWDRVNP